MSKNKFIKALLLNGYKMDEISKMTIIGVDEEKLVNIIDESGKYYRLDPNGISEPLLVENINIQDVIDSEEEKSKKPRGWALYSVFVDEEGNVYHKGVIQSELKGSLPTTIVKK
jgi:hypothetical protein